MIRVGDFTQVMVASAAGAAATRNQPELKSSGRIGEGIRVRWKCQPDPRLITEVSHHNFKNSVHQNLICRRASDVIRAQLPSTPDQWVTALTG